MSIKIGTNPIAWSNDDMQNLGQHISLNTCLSQAHDAGYQGIELGHKFPRDAAKLKLILQKYNIDLIGGWYSTELLRRSADDEIAALQDHINLLKNMNCKIFILAETSNAIHAARDIPLAKSPCLSDDQWNIFTDRMNIICAYIRDQGMETAYHHHMGTVIENKDEIDRFMDMTTDDVGFLMDAGHAAFAGIDPVALTTKYATRITHIHCKDIRLNICQKAINKDYSFLDAVLEGAFTVPGDGNINFPDILKQLAKIDYNGWLVVEAEQDPEKYDPQIYAKLGYDNLLQMAKDVKLI